MLTLNPGFVLIAAALLFLARRRGCACRRWRARRVLAIWLMLDREFGAASHHGADGRAGHPAQSRSAEPYLRHRDADRDGTDRALFRRRRNRFEDSAFLLLAGGAVSALFVGDLVSFVAAAELAALAMAGVVFASTAEGAGASGVRLLIWFGLEGLLFLVGAALHLSAGADSSVFTRLMCARSATPSFCGAADPRRRATRPRLVQGCGAPRFSGGRAGADGIFNHAWRLCVGAAVSGRAHSHTDWRCDDRHRPSLCRRGKRSARRGALRG